MESGLFLIMLIMGFIFMFVGFKKGDNIAAFFRIIAVAMFALIAVVIGTGEGVSQTITSTDGYNTWTETNVLVPEGEGGYYLSYVFTGLSIFNLIAFVKESWGFSGK
jgi:hypothetical protein